MTQPSNLNCDFLVSKFAFAFDLYRYTAALEAELDKLRGERRRLEDKGEGLYKL